jgi:multidrug efflux pump subunit AcrB
MRKLIEYFIKYPILGNLLMFMFLIFGYFGYQNMKKSFFPERESRMIKIEVTFPGASPEEVEEGIVQKIEDNLKGLTGIERVSSVSSENRGNITVEVLKGYNTDKILQDVKNAVDRISSFPVGIEPPVIFKQENLSFAISFAISGDVDLKTLKDYAQEIEDELMSVEGISKVELSGYPQEEIEIGVREEGLRKYNLTFQQIADAVRKANIELTGGNVKGPQEELLIRARSKEYYAEDIKSVIVKTNEDGSAVRLREVADVTDKWEDNPQRSYLNNNPSVVITIQNTLNEDVIFITDYVNSYIEKFNRTHDVVKAKVIRDGSIPLRQRIELLSENGIIGFFLVVLLLSMFLNWRLAFWVALSIPIAFSGMFILASLFHVTINVISLFGMILVVGILVDDGIVISENIYQHYERGENPLKAAVNGTLGVLPSVTSAILTTVVGFSIFFFLEGRLGEFITDMAFVVITTLVISLLEAIFILPSHVAHSKALKRDSKPSLIERKTAALMDFMRDRIYAPMLRFFLHNKAFALAIPIGLFIITISSLKGGIIKTTFFPNIERDNVIVNLAMPAGTREDITAQWLDHIQQAAWEVNKELKKEREDSLDVILSVEKKIGPSSYEGSLNIIMLDGETRKMSDYIIANRIREKAGPVPGAEKVSYGMDSPFGKAVSVSLLGYNKDQLREAKEELKAELKSLKSVKDVVDTDQQGLREIVIKLKDKAYFLGLQLQDVVVQVRQGFFGTEVQRLQRNKDEVRVWVRYKTEERKSLEDLENMLIRLPDGREFFMRDIAETEVIRGVTAIQHLDGMREIRVEADIASPKESVTDIVFHLQSEVVPAILKKYPEVKASYEGQSRESAKTGRSVGKVGPIVLILMIAIVIITFRSFLQAGIVILLIPFAFIGVAWGHFVHGAAISVLSAYGIIALIGVMINDSLVFITTMNEYLKHGKTFMDAVYEAGVSRFRPILLTSLTTIAGLAPLILERSLQAQFLIPMAISMAYGLLIATLLMLITLPVLLVLFNHLRVYVKWLWTGKKPAKEEVEPAIREMKTLG